MTKTYENISEIFNNKNCKLITSKEEFEIIKQTKIYEIS